VVAAACLLTSRAALAMNIQQFERMLEEDQHAYVTDLVWGAAVLLEEDCKPQVAARVRRLFIHALGVTDNDSLEGTQRFGDRLLLAGRRAAERPEQAGNIRVDDALRATLRDQGITLPDRFAAIDRAFSPQGPPAWAASTPACISRTVSGSPRTSPAPLRVFSKPATSTLQAAASTSASCTNRERGSPRI
jgi:hypothetical protein